MRGSGERLAEIGDRHEPRAQCLGRSAVEQIVGDEIGQHGVDIGQRLGGRGGVGVPQEHLVARAREADRPGAPHESRTDNGDFAHLISSRFPGLPEPRYVAQGACAKARLRWSITACTRSGRSAEGGVSRCSASGGGAQSGITFSSSPSRNSRQTRNSGWMARPCPARQRRLQHVGVVAPHAHARLDGFLAELRMHEAPDAGRARRRNRRARRGCEAGRGGSGARGRRNRRAPPQQQPHCAKPPRPQRGILQPRDAQGEVEPLRHEIDAAVAQREIERDVGIGLQEARQRRRHVADAERQRRGDAHAPARGRRLLDRLVLGGLAVLQDARSPAPAPPARLPSATAAARCATTNVTPSLSSSRRMALETVGLERPRSSAARAKEPSSATRAKIAQASRSGSRRVIFGNDEMPSLLFRQVRSRAILASTNDDPRRSTS